jgi:hypothetical protein
MIKSGLLIGGHIAYLGKLAEEVRTEDVSLFIAASLDDVKRIFANETIDIVFLGLESDPEYRLQVLSHVFAVSPTSSIHLMGKGDDPLLFVSEMLLRYHPRDSG